MVKEKCKTDFFSQTATNGTASSSNAGVASGPVYKFFVPGGTLSPGIVFVGFEMPGELVEEWIT